MDNIVVAGASGHAKVVIDVIEQQGRYHIAGLLDPERPVGTAVLSYPVLGCEAELPTLAARHSLAGFIVAIGNNRRRAIVAETIARLCPHLAFVAAVHPAASIGKDSVIGAGTVVMAGAVVNPSCRIGRGCIVNTKASLDHDSVLDDFASLAPGVTTGGNCVIGTQAAIGIGAVLFAGINVGGHAIVGGGALVLNDVAAGVVAYGMPAREIRRLSLGAPCP